MHIRGFHRRKYPPFLLRSPQGELEGEVLYFLLLYYALLYFVWNCLHFQMNCLHAAYYFVDFAYSLYLFPLFCFYIPSFLLLFLPTCRVGTLSPFSYVWLLQATLSESPRMSIFHISHKSLYQRMLFLPRYLQFPASHLL